MRVLLTGGCGYQGSVLLPKLEGHKVTVLDTGWFGGDPDIKADIRDIRFMENYDAIIHLAGIANDPCGELDSKLTWEVNVLGTMMLLQAAVWAGVKQFIFVSSASVYGVSPLELTETDRLEVVSDYNKTKMAAERVVLSYSDKMKVQILRPATVCGYSPRMRLDTMVNSFTIQALTEGRILVHTGQYGTGLMRPNIHIEDVTDLYVFMLEHPEFTGIYNAGFENLSIIDTAQLVMDKVTSWAEITEVKDKRSYRINSDKLLKTGFKPKHTVSEAIDDIIRARIKPQDHHFNLKWMKLNGWVA